MSGPLSDMKIPRIELYGLGDTTKSYPHVFGGREVKMANFGFETPVSDRYANAMPLGDVTALFNAYLHTQAEEPEFTWGISPFLCGLFEKANTATMTRNACKYITEKAYSGKDMPVIWTVNPLHFELNKEDLSALKPYWEAVIGEGSEQFESLLPQSGYVEWTCDGAFMPESGNPFRPRGVPYSTVRSRGAAIKSWTDAGFSKELAKKAVSYVWTKKIGLNLDVGDKGTYAVNILLGCPLSGSLGIDFVKKPDQEVIMLV